MPRKPRRESSPLRVYDALRSYRARYAPRRRRLYLYALLISFAKSVGPVMAYRGFASSAGQEACATQINNPLTEVSSCIDRMASASNFAIDNDLIRLDPCAVSDNGIEFVTTVSFNIDASIRCTAWPESTACVAQA